MVNDRFEFREICDDDKMYKFFTRTINTVRDRYNEMVRMETIKFDPMVSRYFEQEITVDGNTSMRDDRTTVNDGRKSSSNSNTFIRDDYVDYTGYDKFHDETEGERDGEGEKHDIGHDGRQYSNSSSNSSSSSSADYSGSNTTIYNHDHIEGSNNNSEINHSATKQAPMNASGVHVDGTTGKLKDLDFNYASVYSQNDTTGNSGNQSTDIVNGTNTTTGNTSSSASETGHTSGSGSEGVDKSLDNEYADHNEYYDKKDHRYDRELHDHTHGTDVNTGGGSETTRNTASDLTTRDGSNSEVRHNRYTGREGVLPQDALNRAMNYLQNYSTAFEWLCNKLEINFINIYEI